MIYVVEDNPDIGSILEYFLTGEGFQVNLLPTATDFKQAVNQSLPDLLLMDVMLPDGNGIELCHQLRAAGQSKHLPIIMMSANTDVTASHCDADEFISKPFDLFNLLEKIRQHLYLA